MRKLASGHEGTLQRRGRLRLPGAAFAGLSGKFTLLYVATMLLLVGATVLLSIRSLTEVLTGEYRDKALAVVRAFDAQYSSPTEIQGSRFTQEYIDRLMALNPGIYKISLYVPDEDRVVRTASSDKHQIGQPAGLHDAEPIATDRTVLYEETEEGERLIEILAPLHVDGQAVASVGVYLRLAPRDEVVRSQAVRFAAIGILAATLLLIVLYLSLDWLLLQPVSLLKRSTQAIERGLLHTRISLRRQDELGELAAAFNGMADALERRERENQQLQRQLQEKYDQAKAQAVTDPITGLYNHRYFQDRLNHELERAHRFGTPVTLLFGDIDHFKTLNDTYGHQFGDQILREIADLLKGAVREIDTVARYGGEEFAIILPGTDRRGGHQAGERIRRMVADHVFGADPDLPQAITVSLGVAAYPEDGQWREDLIWRADHAMYYAKRLGRNQVRTYGELAELRGADSQQLDQEVLSEDAYLNLVRSLATAVDARDHYYLSHSEGVARYAMAIAEAMGAEGRQLRDVGIAGLLHDVGKIGIPDAILAKPGPLAEEEWQKVREHPSIGEAIVKQIVYLDQVVPLIASHHERFDGSGYPHGISGDQIPMGARILAVADAYHSMISPRPYRQAKSQSEATAELCLKAGTQFDPVVVDAFLATLDPDGGDKGPAPAQGAVAAWALLRRVALKG